MQRIERYGIDLYTQLRSYSLDSTTEPDVKDIVVGTFGTKLRSDRQPASEIPLVKVALSTRWY